MHTTLLKREVYKKKSQEGARLSSFQNLPDANFWPRLASSESVIFHRFSNKYPQLKFLLTSSHHLGFCTKNVRNFQKKFLPLIDTHALMTHSSNSYELHKKEANSFILEKSRATKNALNSSR